MGHYDKAREHDYHERASEHAKTYNWKLEQKRKRCKHFPTQVFLTQAGWWCKNCKQIIGHWGESNAHG